jgi:hypothetical protein
MEQVDVAVNAVSTFVRGTVPAWLNSLPVPETLAGFAELTSSQWVRLAPLFLVVLAHVIVFLHFFTRAPAARINTQIDLQSEVVSPSRGTHAAQATFCRGHVVLISAHLPPHLAQSSLFWLFFLATKSEQG